MKRKLFAVLLVIVIMSVFIGCNNEASITPNGAEKQQKSQKSIVLNEKEISTEPSTNVVEEPSVEPSTEIATEKIQEKENIPEATKSKEPSTKSNSKNSSSPAQSANSSYIGVEKAKSIALNHAGISEAEAKFLEIELDRDDYIKKYEISFRCGDFEYDYEINAETGKVISAEKEYDSIYD